VSRRLEREAREHAREADMGHQHHMAGGELSWRERLTSVRAWSDVAHNFRGDWQMLWKEITVGFVLAGFVAQFDNGFFEHLFIRHAPGPLPTIENVLVGPVIDGDSCVGCERERYGLPADDVPVVGMWSWELGDREVAVGVEHVRLRSCTAERAAAV
jgi:hypothetical protein